MFIHCGWSCGVVCFYLGCTPDGVTCMLCIRPVVAVCGHGVRPGGVVGVHCIPPGDVVRVQAVNMFNSSRHRYMCSLYPGPPGDVVWAHRIIPGGVVWVHCIPPGGVVWVHCID